MKSPFPTRRNPQIGHLDKLGQTEKYKPETHFILGQAGKNNRHLDERYNRGNADLNHEEDIPKVSFFVNAI